MQEKFDNLVNNYKNLSIDNKRESLIKEIKEMIAVYINVANMYDIPINILKSKEILDIQTETYNENDYIEAVYVYFNILKEITSNIIHNRYVDE